MDDQLLLEQAQSLTPIYVDGFGAFRKINGVMRTVGYLIEGGAQLNLICSLGGAGQAAQDGVRVLNEKAPAIHFWGGLRLAAH